jgi:hypothetical protein
MQIIPGTGISISPTGGTGNVTINSTTLVASSSCVLVPDSTIYIGNSTYGWNNTTWDLNDTSFVTANINCGVPLPIDALQDSVITVCGIAYIDGTGDKTKSDFGVSLYGFNCAYNDRDGISTLTSSTVTNAFSIDGIYCFTLSYIVPKNAELFSCTDFLLVGFTAESAIDSTELRISYTIKIT